MKISCKWLKEYVDIRLRPQKLAEVLTMGGLAVESVDQIGDDTSLTIDVTSNRPDCLSMIGVARELALLCKGKLTIPKITIPSGTEESPTKLSLTVDDQKLCPRYIGRVITGVKVAPSPDWLQERLISVGIRPINNIVDITNYVLMECGQPLHAFDYNLLNDGAIVVRRAKPGETIIAIDGKEYRLDTSMLVIADNRRPVAVAGVMGGKESEINGSTTTLVLESALFDPVSIRKTSKALALASESSYRFERGVSWEGIEWASRRAAQLITEIAGGTVLAGAPEKRVKPPQPIKTYLREERVREILGVEIPASFIKKYLKDAGFNTTLSKNRRNVVVPPWRRDINAEVDIIEEIAKTWGYDNIPSDTRIAVRPVSIEKPDFVRRKARELLVGLGYKEVMTSSFIEEKGAMNTCLISNEPPLELTDPRGKAGKHLRGSLVFSLYNIMRINEGYKENPDNLFEIAAVYYRQKGKPTEKESLAVVSTGGYGKVKGAVEELFSALGLDELHVIREEIAGFQKGRSAIITLRDQRIGVIGEMDDKVREFYDMRKVCGAAEIDFEMIVSSARTAKKFKMFSRFPPVKRDLAIVVDSATTWEEIKNCVLSVAPDFLDRIDFFDQFTGGSLPVGKKSIAFSMSIQAGDRTLASSEVDEAVKVIVQSLKERLGGELRQ